MDIERFNTALDELAQAYPPKFFDELSGGIMIQPQSKIPGYAMKDDLYIMGEYHYDPRIGNRIIIYYGSFAAVYGHLSDDELKKRLGEVLAHEFRHHMERRMGVRDLEKQDEVDRYHYLAARHIDTSNKCV